MSVLMYKNLTCIVRDDGRKSGSYVCHVIIRELTADAVDIEETYTVKLAPENEMEARFPHLTPFAAGHAYAAVEACNIHGYNGKLLPAYFGDDTVFVGIDAE